MIFKIAPKDQIEVLIYGRKGDVSRKTSFQKVKRFASGHIQGNKCIAIIPTLSSDARSIPLLLQQVS
jgi:hypothetical protein